MDSKKRRRGKGRIPGVARRRACVGVARVVLFGLSLALAGGTVFYVKYGYAGIASGIDSEEIVRLFCAGPVLAVWAVVMFLAAMALADDSP